MDLLGIVLVSQSQIEGTKLLLRYPPVVRNTVAQETLADFIETSPQEAPSDMTNWGGVPGESNIMSSDKPSPHTEVYDLPSVLLAPALMPKRLMCNKPFHLTIEDTTFIGFPSTFDQKEKSGTSTSTIRGFNMVFCLSKGLDIHGILPALKTAARSIASALIHQELSCGYLTGEFTKLARLREQWLWMCAQPQHKDNKPDILLLIHQLVKISPLAATIRDMYHRLRLSGTFHMQINRWCSVSISLWNSQRNLAATFRPYHALLITDPELTEITHNFANLPLLLSKAKPNKSFSQLQMETNIPIQHLYRLAAHLVYWRTAIVIDVLARDNYYVLNPRPVIPISSPPITLEKKFIRHFPKDNLLTLLKRFSVCKSLGEHLDDLSPSESRNLVRSVVWLLAHNLLVQLHRYIYFIPPNQTEEAYLSSVADGSTTFLLLQRLLPYFRGQCHTHEIRFRENLSKEELVKVLEQFSAGLITVQHEK